ncbi:MAG: glycosyltransferase [Pseudomonadota bacterium]
MKLFILVTHLHGTGHFVRMAEIARRFVERGHTVTLVTGGFPLPHIALDRRIELTQLPPVGSFGLDFSKLDTGIGVADGTYLEARARLVSRLFEEHQPDCLITELFPFGRRTLAREFSAVLETARTSPWRPLVLCSVRDVLEPPRTVRKAEFARRMVADFYDGILVHGDRDFISLDESWPGVEDLPVSLHYTGYVADHGSNLVRGDDPVATSGHRDTILVSAGGGPLGTRLFDTALDLCVSGYRADRTWRFLVGGGDRETQIERLRVRARDCANVVIEAVRADYTALLANAHLVIQRAGYNSFLDFVRFLRPTVLCPYDDGGEREQTLRAEAAAKMFLTPMLPSEQLTVDALGLACEDALAIPAKEITRLTLKGGDRTVQIIEDMLSARRSI